MKLQGKKACVTGSGRGIGKAIAIAFAREGADVCVGARSKEEIESVAAEIEACGVRGAWRVCDVGKRSDAEELIRHTVETFGGIDILVNNAGIGTDAKRVVESDPDRWVRTFEVNLFGAYYTSRIAIPYLRESEAGKIINVGSGLAHRPRTDLAGYCASKAALRMLTRCLALELADSNVDVNEFTPGLVHTASTAHALNSDADYEFQPGDGRHVRMPEECAPMVVFLASQPARGPTGQTFSISRNVN